MTRIAKLLNGGLAGLMLATGAPAFAQTADSQIDKQKVAAGSANADTSGDIIVTAQKRAERVMDVPISLTAFDSAQLEARNIIDLSKLGFYTPGLEVTPSPGGGAGITLRGITTGVGGVGVDPSVGVYVDGAYVSRDWVGQQTYLDVDRVEVLRGPQGTLYGRNTTGGAYNIYHKAPTTDWTVGGEVDFGSYDKQRYDAYLSGPLVGDKVLARIAIGRDTADEYGRNLLTGKRLQQTDSLQGIATLELRPTNNLTITLRGDAMKDDGANSALYHVVRPGTANADADLPTNPYEYRADFTADGNYVRNRGWNAQIDWNLGGYQLKSISAGRLIRINTEYDTDSTELPIYTAVLNDKSKTFSQEFQLVSPTGGRFDWIVGAYYYHENAHDLTTTGGPYPYGPFYLYDGAGIPLQSGATYLSLTIPFDNRGRFDSNNITNSYAAYAQARYQFTDKLRATIGLRYTDEHRTFSGTAGQTFIPEGSAGVYGYDPAAACSVLIAKQPVTLPAGLSDAQAQAICVSNVNADLAAYANTNIVNRSDQRLKFSNLSERFVLDYYPSTETHLYASATSGFKSGGFNSYDTDAAYSGSAPGDPGVPVIAFQPPFGPEKLWSFEIGAKGTLFDRTLNYSVDAFYYLWSNIQSQVYNYTNRTSNITNDARAHAKGIEVDLSSQPWHNGEIDFNGAWIDSEYTHFGSTIDDVLTGETNVDFTGTALPGSPKWKWNFGVQQTAQTDLGNLTLRGEYQHRSATFFAYTKDPLARGGRYDIFNARLTWTDPKSRLSAGVFVENVFNQDFDYYRYGASTTGLIAIVGPPREFGVRLSADF